MAMALRDLGADFEINRNMGCIEISIPKIVFEWLLD